MPEPRVGDGGQGGGGRGGVGVGGGAGRNVTSGSHSLRAMTAITVLPGKTPKRHWQDAGGTLGIPSLLCLSIPVCKMRMVLSTVDATMGCNAQG